MKNKYESLLNCDMTEQEANSVFFREVDTVPDDERDLLIEAHNKISKVTFESICEN